MVFPPCPSMKRLFQGSPRRPWESSSGVPDALSPLPVEERAIPGTPPEGLTIFGESTRDGLFPLPVEAIAISAPHRKSLRVLSGSAFSLCPSRERQFLRGRNRGLRVSFHPACRGKAILMRQKFLSVPEGCKTRSLSMKKASPTLPEAPRQPFSLTGRRKRQS